MQTRQTLLGLLAAAGDGRTALLRGIERAIVGAGAIGEQEPERTAESPMKRQGYALTTEAASRIAGMWQAWCLASTTRCVNSTDSWWSIPSGRQQTLLHRP